MCFYFLGKTVEAYITALYKLSSTCNFGTMTERLMKDRLLVIRIRDDKAREKLLDKEQLDLETCIDNKMLQITHAYVQEINTDVTTDTVKYKSARQTSQQRTIPEESKERSTGVMRYRSTVMIDHCVQAAGGHGSHQ